MKKSFFLLLFFLALTGTTHAAAVRYEVVYSGVKNRELLLKIKDACQLIALKNRPPRSINALRYRADGDIPQIKKILQAYGYYDAEVDTTLIDKKNKILVKVNIYLKMPYQLASYTIFKTPCMEKQPLELCKPFDLSQLELKLGEPVNAQKIIDSRLILLSKLAECGYPLSKVDNQESIVDTQKKTMDIELCVEKGPLCHFGPISLVGLKSIHPQFIEKKIQWDEGDIYSPEKIEDTQKRLLQTDLFSSALITHSGELDESHNLPIKIHLTESKHKSVSIGVSYATIERFGTSFTWANRNFRGMGELLSIEGELAQRYYAGTATYMKPDFRKLDQDFFTRLQASREKIHVYLAFSYSAIARIDRKYKNTWYSSWGVKSEFVDVTNSINNGKYMLVYLPLFLKYSTANSLLNPSRGFSLSYIPVPYASVGNHKSVFFKQVFLAETYFPFTKDDWFVLAFRFQLGSLIGPKVRRLPMTKLFFGGSDDDLRGYRYRTVSPLNSTGDATGGRSAIYFTVEPRFKVTSSIGLVPFLDLGTVDTTQYPNPTHKWHKSTGIGLRYYTFFGPFRLDVGFPLNRRKDIDPRYRIYASIGQTF